MRKLFVALLLLVVVLQSVSSQSYEILELDPAVRGVWHMCAVSYDEGRTMQDGDGEALFRVFATYAIGASGERIEFVSIRYFQDSDGVIYNIVKLEGFNTMWSISKEHPPYILVQVWDTTTLQPRETARFLMKL